MKKKKNNQIPLYNIKLSSNAINEVKDSLKTGWLSPGPKVTSFEKAICSLMQTRYGALVSSATAGLQLALTAVGVRPGKEVITTPFTFVATVEAIIAAGAKPVFADIDPHSLNIDPIGVSSKITNQTAAVMPLDLGGLPANYDMLRDICKVNLLYLIGDSAHSIGSLYKNKPVSKYSDAAVISFHATKNLICGEGGIVLSRHKKLIDRVRTLSQHGMTANAYQRKSAQKWEYDVINPGFKANMSEIHAAIGLGQLSVFDREQKKRRALAKRYLKNLADFSEHLETPIEEKYIQHGWHLFIIKLHFPRLKINRNSFIKRMSEYGIECGVHYKPVFELSYYKKALKLSSSSFPNAHNAWQRVVTLPLYPTLTFAQVDYISECIEKIVKKYSL
ncbi:MAG: DegT/DnrJ/EryC1/StrS family aminotransferase [Candidatus Zixiibacteriota bacterium]